MDESLAQPRARAGEVGPDEEGSDGEGSDGEYLAAIMWRPCDRAATEAARGALAAAGADVHFEELDDPSEVG